MEKLTEKQLKKIEEAMREAVGQATHSLCQKIPVMKMERPVIRAIISKNVGRLGREIVDTVGIPI